LSYQWLLNGTNLSGATGATLNLNNVQLSDAGTYSVVVSNAISSTNSADAMLTVNVPACVAPPSGLVSWWRAEGNALDAAGTNNGTLVSGAYASGKVGQAFNLNGSSGYVSVPASSTLDVGAGSGLTIECWINPADVQLERPLLEWNNNSDTPGIGAHFWISTAALGGGAGSLWLNLLDTTGNGHAISSAPGFVVPNQWQHVAATFDRSSQVAKLYYNGVLVATTNFATTSFIPQTSYNLYLGRRISGIGSASFPGLLDEMSLYNRALSGPEIAAIYNAVSAGKCFTPTAASIVTQPQSQSANTGGNASFSVGASGTGPLSYQWLLNGTNLSGATASTLSLTNVQLTDAGTYSVVVSNAFGPAVTSSNATLTVTAVAPSIVTQPQSKSILAGANTSFSVVASGANPLGYQWLFQGANITNANSSLLSLTNVQPSNAGGYSVLVTSPSGSITSSIATLTVTLPPSALRVVSLSATSGIVTVPISLISQGNENAFGFSLNFSASSLKYIGIVLADGMPVDSSLVYNTNQLPNGRLGVGISLPFGTSLTAGTQEIAEVSFFVTENPAGTYSTPISFGDLPILRQISDAQAITVTATYASGSVTIPFLGYEGDVAPRTNGNNVVSTTDWVQVGRFVAGLDTITNGSEFQRLDCAPRSTLGNGLITVADWVQAGRYAFALDPLTGRGGPTQDLSGGGSLFAAKLTPKAVGGTSGGSGRIVRVASGSAQAGQACQVSVQLDSQGNENALGFDISFDPTALRFKSVVLGSGTGGASLTVNTNQVGSGIIGVLVGLPIGNTFSAATLEVLKLSFTVVSAAKGNTSVSFASKPVTPETVDAAAGTLATSYSSGSLSITAIVSPMLSIMQTDTNLVLSWPASAVGFNPEASSNGLSATNWTGIAGTPVTNGTDLNLTLPLPATQNLYRLRHP
jgi:hypothetical protein